MVFRRILAAADDSPSARRAFDRALTLARHWDADVVLGHVCETVPDEAHSLLTASNLEEMSQREAEWGMNQLTEVAGDQEVRVLIRSGRDIAGTLCEMADDEDVDLVTMGTLGRTGIARFLIGSVTEQVVRRAPCPVWVERGSGSTAGRLERLVVATDLSPMSEAGLELAAALATDRSLGAEVVCAVEPRYRQLAVDVRKQLIVGLTAQVEALAKKHFGDADPRVTIVEGANVVDAVTAHLVRTSADLLVVSTHGRTGLERVLMGSVAEQLVRFSPCSVLTARSPAAG